MAVNRSLVNLARFVLEDLLPPVLRDSPLFLPIMYLAYGRDARRFMTFRERVREMPDAEYASYYAALSPLMGETDLNRACKKAILGDVIGESVADIGCGRFHLIRLIAEAHPAVSCVGVDILPPADPSGPVNLSFLEGWLGRLPFPDRTFDTVVCTHTLEHVPDLQGALADLRRITRRRLILVVPREREARYPLNLHVHFFPYLHTFLNRVKAPPGRYRARLLGRDIYYREDMDGQEPPMRGSASEAV